MYLFIILAMGAGFLVQMMLKSRMNKYSQVANPLNLSGKEIAEKMLKDNNIEPVEACTLVMLRTNQF